jgi:hypothetical protein
MSASDQKRPLIEGSMETGVTHIDHALRDVSHRVRQR